jgi:hypothetical protein
MSKKLELVAYMDDPVSEETYFRSTDQNGMGRKIVTDTKVQTNLSKRFYRVYYRFAVNYHNPTENFLYIVVKGQPYKIRHDDNGNMVGLRKYNGYI